MKETHCKEPHCPICNLSSSISDIRVLSITFDEWPLSLSFASAALMLAVFLGLSPAMSVFFAFLAIVPLMFVFEKKTACDICGVEFESL